MSEELEAALADVKAGKESLAYVLVGEEFLIRQAAERLLEQLAPGGSTSLNVVTMDASTPREVAAELGTLPMFGGRKVVVLREPEFLAPKKGRPDALSRARDAWKANRRKEAARRVLTLVSRAGWGADELRAPKIGEWDKELGIELQAIDVQFLKEVGAFCEAEGVEASASDDASLLAWLKQAHTEQLHGAVLVMVSSVVESKHALLKWVMEYGQLLEFKVASKLKELDLTAFAKSVLGPLHKTLGPGALDALKERVGGNFRLLQSELTKLALYSSGSSISRSDVELLVGQVREDEFFELSQAVQQRNFPAALKFAQMAFSQGTHPIVLLGSLAGITRTLLSSFERLARFTQGKPLRNYQDFQARVWPRIEEESKANKSKVPHPYAAFMGMQAAAQWSRDELLRGLVACAETDLALKLGGQELALERLLWTLCGKATAWDSQMHFIRREQER